MIKKILALSMAVMACFLTACGENGGTSVPAPDESLTCDTQHHCTKIRAKDPTCEKVGNIEYWSCYVCDKLFADENATQELSASDVVVQKFAHSPVFVDENQSTCAVKGNVPYYYCASCYNFFEDEACSLKIENKSSVQLGKTKHTLSHTDATTPNGYVNGNVEYWHCSECYAYFSDEKGMREITQEATVILSAYNVPDFVVEVPANRDPVVLQITDTQIIDAGQTRPGRGGVDHVFWATDKMDERCYNYITELVNATHPDLILLTGDIIYGEFDDNGSALLKFIAFMESLQIPWAPIFGNHDNESKMGADWQCQQLEAAQYCLFEQKTLTGNGNYSVAIAQGGEVKRVFYMLDTNGCGAASSQSLSNGHTKTSVGLGEDQIEWYTEEITAVKAVAPNVKISFAYHIQAAIFGKAYEKYGFNQAVLEQDVNLDLRADTASTDFGYIGRQMKNPWDEDFTIFKGMKALGADSIFVGHEHCNSASVVYEGVRFQFGQKTSEYDRFNYIRGDGSIAPTIGADGKSLMGGTVIPLDKEDGAIKTPYIYYCGYPNGEIDWSQWK